MGKKIGNMGKNGCGEFGVTLHAKPETQENDEAILYQNVMGDAVDGIADDVGSDTPTD